MEDPKKKTESDEGRNLKKLGLVAVIIGDLVGFVGVGIGVGYYAWSHWGAPWWVLILSSSAGLILAFYQLYQVSQKS